MLSENWLGVCSDFVNLCMEITVWFVFSLLKLFEIVVVRKTVYVFRFVISLVLGSLIVKYWCI